MANTTISGRIRQAAYTAAVLAAANPVLLDREVVYERDTGRYKIGDGTTPWNALPYSGTGAPTDTPATISVTARVSYYYDPKGLKTEPSSGAEIHVDAFAVAPGLIRSIPTQVIQADENGVARFTVPQGYTFSAYATSQGTGASPQFTFLAGDTDMDIQLNQLPVGYFIKGVRGYYPDATAWAEAGDNIYSGLAIVTKDTAFMLMPHRSVNYFAWGRYQEVVPTLPQISPATEGSIEAAQAIALADFNGALNTAKILATHTAPPAATYCRFYNLTEQTDEHIFLSSAGQVHLIYSNRIAINEILSAVNKQRPNSAQTLNNDWLWTSSQTDANHAWVINAEAILLPTAIKTAYFYILPVGTFL